MPPRRPARLDRPWRGVEVSDWSTLAAFVVLVVGLRLGAGTESMTALDAGTVVLITLLLFAATVQARRNGRLIVLGALSLAVYPGVLASAVAGSMGGMAAIAAACVIVLGEARLAAPKQGKSASDQRTIGGMIGLAVVWFGLISWWATSDELARSERASWTAAISSTGDFVRHATSFVHAPPTMLPASTHLMWWCGVGVLLGAAILGGQWRLAAVVPGGAAIFVLTTWMIAVWRGDVDALAGAWLWTIALVVVGTGARLDPSEDKRIGALVIALAGLVSAIGLGNLIWSVGGPIWTLGLTLLGQVGWTAGLLGAPRGLFGGDQRDSTGSADRRPWSASVTQV